MSAANLDDEEGYYDDDNSFALRWYESASLRLEHGVHDFSNAVMRCSRATVELDAVDESTCKKELDEYGDVETAELECMCEEQAARYTSIEDEYKNALAEFQPSLWSVYDTLREFECESEEEYVPEPQLGHDERNTYADEAHEVMDELKVHVHQARLDRWYALDERLCQLMIALRRLCSDALGSVSRVLILGSAHIGCQCALFEELRRCLGHARRELAQHRSSVGERCLGAVRDLVDHGVRLRREYFRVRTSIRAELEFAQIEFATLKSKLDHFAVLRERNRLKELGRISTRAQDVKDRINGAIASKFRHADEAASEVPEETPARNAEQPQAAQDNTAPPGVVCRQTPWFQPRFSLSANFEWCGDGRPAPVQPEVDESGEPSSPPLSRPRVRPLPQPSPPCSPQSLPDSHPVRFELLRPAGAPDLGIGDDAWWDIDTYYPGTHSEARALWDDSHKHLRMKMAQKRKVIKKPRRPAVAKRGHVRTDPGPSAHAPDELPPFCYDSPEELESGASDPECSDADEVPEADEYYDSSGTSESDGVSGSGGLYESIGIGFNIWDA